MYDDYTERAIDSLESFCMEGGDPDYYDGIYLGYYVNDNGSIVLQNSEWLADKIGRRYSTYYGYSLVEAKHQHCIENDLDFDEVVWVKL